MRGATDDGYMSSSFWSDLRPYLFTKEMQESACREVDGVIGLSMVQAGSILDVCCGPGRHSLEFARRGFDVLGLDMQQAFLEQARRLATEENLGCKFRFADARDYDSGGEFDLAVSLGSSLGYGKQDADDIRIMRNVWASLRAGGAFVVETLTSETVARWYKPYVVSTEDDGKLLVRRQSIRDDWTRLDIEWLLLNDGAYSRRVSSMRLYSGREICEAMMQAGFNTVSIFGDLSGTKYGFNSERAVVLGYKTIVDAVDNRAPRNDARASPMK